MITTKGKANYAKSMINDGRTTYRRNQSNPLDIGVLITDIEQRPDAVYDIGDNIRLADGTLRKIIHRYYNQSKKAWLYRLNTNVKNQYGGTVSSPEHTEEEIQDMDTSQSFLSIQPKTSNKWVVQFMSETTTDYHTWITSDGDDALFDYEIAVQFAQGLVMAHDAKKQWAIFRIRPHEGREGEQYFFTLMQPDGKYTIAVSSSAEVGDDNMVDVSTEDFKKTVIFGATTNPEMYYFAASKVEQAWKASVKGADFIGYSNPNRPIYKVGDVCRLPSGIIRKIQFITPYWKQAGQVGFKYWFYIQGKQLVSFTQDAIIKASARKHIVDVSPLIISIPLTILG